MQDRPTKRHSVAKPGGTSAVEVDLADRLVGCGARPRVAAEDAVSGVTGLELSVIAGGETEILGRPPEHLA